MRRKDGLLAPREGQDTGTYDEMDTYEQLDQRLKCLIRDEIRCNYCTRGQLSFFDCLNMGSRV